MLLGLEKRDRESLSGRFNERGAPGSRGLPNG